MAGKRQRKRAAQLRELIQSQRQDMRRDVLLTRERFSSQKTSRLAEELKPKPRPTFKSKRKKKSKSDTATTTHTTPTGFALAFCDGGCVDGLMTIGVTVSLNGQRIYEHGAFRGQGTNNVAEYEGLLHLLKWAKTAGLAGLDVRMDSQLIVKQVHGEWECKMEHLRPMRNDVRTLIAELANDGTPVLLRWVPRSLNHRADKLASDALAAYQSSQAPIWA